MTSSGDNPVDRALGAVLASIERSDRGVVANYIPELASADPTSAAIALTSTSGHLYAVGDHDVAFTLQSISKPFVYALVLGQLGVDRLHAHVGFEPSGEPFNAISLDDSGRPANPMINAGAIVTSALVGGSDEAERFESIRATLSAFAGRELEMDERVYASEAATGDRNRALAHLARAAGNLARQPDDAADGYFRQCALLVTTTDVSVMGATLANGGVNPVTGVEVVLPSVARRTLSLMASCGMYDHAGEWAYRVGMPAKSGVSGGIVAVKPGQFGIGVYSPGLDAAGNSSRGVAALTLLADEFGLHLLEHPATPATSVDRLINDPIAGLTVVLRGELTFTGVEHVAYEIAHLLADDATSALTIDTSSVTRITPAAQRLLDAVVAQARSQGRSVRVGEAADMPLVVDPGDGPDPVGDRIG